MISLNLPPALEQAIYRQAEQTGVSVEHYLQQQIEKLIKPNVAQFVRGKKLDSFPNDVTTWQQEIRND